MNLTINNYIVADIRIRSVHLQKLVGAYELVLLLELKINSSKDGARWLRLDGVDIRIKSTTGAFSPLGQARPIQALPLRQNDFVTNTTVQMGVVLQPYQLACLEELRNGEDLVFDLTALGVGSVSGASEMAIPINDVFSERIAKSEWIKRLREAGALDVILIEVSAPVIAAPERQRQTIASLKAAEKYFADGDYSACVATCRDVFEALEVKASSLKSFGSSPEHMSKEERAAAMFAAIRHYSHLAHHASSQLPSTTYRRREAKLMLQLTAATACFESAN